MALVHNVAESVVLTGFTPDSIRLEEVGLGSVNHPHNRHIELTPNECWLYDYDDKAGAIAAGYHLRKAKVSKIVLFYSSAGPDMAQGDWRSRTRDC